MALFTFFHEFKNYLGDKIIDLNSDTFRGILTNVAPDAAANQVKADITEIAAGFGYSAGGVVLTGVTWLETGAGLGVWRFTANDPSWTAIGGSIATHRWLVVFDDTPAAPLDPLVGYVDRGSTDIIADGNTRIWDVGASGLFELN